MAARHLLQRHFPAAQLSVFSTQVDGLIPVGAVSQTPGSTQTDADGVDMRTQSITDAYGTLKSGLQSLPDLPLKIVAITKLSDTLLATSMLIPAPSDAVLAMSGISLEQRRVDGKLSRQLVDMVVTPHEVALEFEFSGKWPQREALPGGSQALADDLYNDEVLSIKSSMLVLIGKSLQDCFGYFSIAEDDLLDVFVGGYVFRLRIHHRRPRNPSELIAQVVTNEKGEEEERARQLHAKLVEAMTSREQNFAVICRVCKRWIGAQMFSLALSNEDVELMVAYLFSNKRRYERAHRALHLPQTDVERCGGVIRARKCRTHACGRSASFSHRTTRKCSDSLSVHHNVCVCVCVCVCVQCARSTDSNSWLAVLSASAV